MYRRRTSGSSPAKTVQSFVRAVGEAVDELVELGRVAGWQDYCDFFLRAGFVSSGWFSWSICSAAAIVSCSGCRAVCGIGFSLLREKRFSGLACSGAVGRAWRMVAVLRLLVVVGELVAVIVVLFGLCVFVRLITLMAA